jgi:Rieske 2Fe-2S family protein
MSDAAMTKLKHLVQTRRPYHMLEAPFYTDPDIFKADLDLIFGRHWIFVGLEPDVPEPGDVMNVKIGNASILIVRDDDNNIHAMHNICRHRGAALVVDEKTSVGRLVCPYHSWTYGLDGSLLHAQYMQDDFDASCSGLRKVHLRSVEGLLFICLAENPPEDFEEFVKTVGPYVAPHDIANCKVVHESDLIEPGNWKLTVENNRECYHCSANHPELTQSIYEFGFGFDAPEHDPSRQALRRHYEGMVAKDLAAWEAAGLPSVEDNQRLEAVSGFRVGRMTMDKAGESQTLDGKIASKKLLGNFTEARLGDLSIHTQPNSWHHLMSDHIVSFAVFPLSAGQTRVKTKWLVHKDAVEGVDYNMENLTRVWRETNVQDSRLVGLSQLGAQSSGYVQGPYSKQTEGQVEQFAAWYIARLKAHLPA